MRTVGVLIVRRSTAGVDRAVSDVAVEAVGAKVAFSAAEADALIPIKAHTHNDSLIDFNISFPFSLLVSFLFGLIVLKIISVLVNP